MPLVCREAFREVCILANGDVVCSCLDINGSRPLGNIKEQRIYDIFRGEKYRQLRKQLMSSGDDTFCPHLGFNCCFKNIPSESMKTDEDSLAIDYKIQLENYSYCNLRCPSCLVSGWMKTKGNPRLAVLPMDCIEEVLEDTKNTSPGLWLFNYGEPFLDRRFLDILQLAKRINPRISIYMHTNGTAIPEGWPEVIIREGLLDTISFSIDGTCQESYGKYRVGGNFDVAFGNMVEIARIRDRLGRRIPQVFWQYILFEWNDSDEELRRAQELAKKNRLKLTWITTHTQGKSQRYLPDSPEFLKLRGTKHYSSEILAEKVPGQLSSAGLFKRIWDRMRGMSL